MARWDSSADLAQYGVSFLLYGLLDYLVDGHFRAVESLDQAVEETEDGLFDYRPGRDRAGAAAVVPAPQEPGAPAADHAARPASWSTPCSATTSTSCPSRMAPYFRDVYDHVIRATEWTESLRDLVTTIVETNLTEQGNRMNLIMKKVTSWAAIIAVPPP